MFAAAVRSVLERAGFEVVQAENRDELLAAARARPADLALVDVQLPPCGGVDAIAALTRQVGTPTVAWDADPRPRTIVAAIRANALGYLPKKVASATLLETVRAASRGEATLPPVVTAEIAVELHRADHRRSASARLASLSRRELDVLALAARGDGNREIGRALAISEFTVKRHMHSILRKLGLDSRRDAAALYEEARGTNTGSAAFGAHERTGGIAGRGGG
jgi:two-component system, NarL family, nitrate/nitrite response regulator NarL